MPTVELAALPAGGVTGWGKVRLTPIGALPTQAAEKVTGELKPPTEFTMTFVDVPSPCAVEIVDEDGASVKSGAAAATGTSTIGVPAIATATWVECAIPPPVAVISSVKVPVEGELPAFNVNVDVPVPFAGTTTGLGRVAVTSAGTAPTQEVARSTCELKPLTEEMITVVDRNAPGLRLIVAGEGCAMKSGEAEATTVPANETVKLRVIEWDTGPLDAVTVSGYVPTATVPGTKMESVAKDVAPEDVAIESAPEEVVPGLALKVPVTPAGPDNERTTGEAKLS
jgi:hypothetical protein